MIERVRQFFNIKEESDREIVNQIGEAFEVARESGDNFGLAEKLSELISSGVDEEKLVECVADALRLETLKMGGWVVDVGLWGERLFPREARRLVRQAAGQHREEPK